MQINITYPLVDTAKQKKEKLVQWMKWPFLALTVITIILSARFNFSGYIPVIFCLLWIVWTNVFGTPMIDVSIISKAVKLICQLCILLIMIDVLIIPGWAVIVVPIVCTVGLLVAIILFMKDYQNQKQNVMPILALLLLALLNSAVSLLVVRQTQQLSSIIMGCVAFVLFLLCFILLRGDVFKEIKKYFCSK